MPVCRLCDAEVPKLADSHVYPKAAHVALHTGDLKAITIDMEPDHPARAVTENRVGTHGPFVCPACEHEAFGLADNEFMRLFHFFGSDPPPPGPNRTAFAPGNPGLIHRFAVQTFWRWYTCQEARQQGDRLAPLLDRFAKALRRPGGTLWMNWSIAMIHGPGGLSMAAMPPVIRGEPGRRVAFMALPRFLFLIPVDRCWFANGVEESRLREEGKVRLLLAEWIDEFMFKLAKPVMTEENLAAVENYIARRRGPKKP